MQIHKYIVLFMIIISFVLLFPYLAYGHVDDKIDYIEIKIETKENGNAIITENWFVNSMERFSYYKLYKNVTPSKLQNFSVTDENGKVYEKLDKWDIYMPNEEKINKCGINYTDEGAELCWGVENNGFHVYTLNYEISNYEYKNFDFIDQRFNASSFGY